MRNGVSKSDRTRGFTRGQSGREKKLRVIIRFRAGGSKRFVVSRAIISCPGGIALLSDYFCSGCISGELFALDRISLGIGRYCDLCATR